MRATDRIQASLPAVAMSSGKDGGRQWGGFWGSGPLGEGDGREVVGMVSSSSSLLTSLGKALLPRDPARIWSRWGHGAGDRGC